MAGGPKRPKGRLVQDFDFEIADDLKWSRTYGDHTLNRQAW